MLKIFSYENLVLFSVAGLIAYTVNKLVRNEKIRSAVVTAVLAAPALSMSQRVFAQTAIGTQVQQAAMAALLNDITALEKTLSATADGAEKEKLNVDIQAKMQELVKMQMQSNVSETGIFNYYEIGRASCRERV